MTDVIVEMEKVICPYCKSMANREKTFAIPKLPTRGPVMEKRDCDCGCTALMYCGVTLHVSPGFPDGPFIKKYGFPGIKIGLSKEQALEALADPSILPMLWQDKEGVSV